LDYATDAALRRALARETAGATVVIVSQRVATVRDADQIVVLDEGTVVGIGTHEELLANNDTYREIVLSQLTENEASTSASIVSSASPPSRTGAPTVVPPQGKGDA
jgi:ATP-binding cassette subfamily B protein